MTLTPGSRFGAYEIVEPVGAGGMGEVYRARDVRLDRNVALKVLPQAFTRDAERLARFDREARVLASLNHPGIAAIHGIEECDGLRALVLEFVEGGTLADRLLAKRTLPVDETIEMTRQIAEALDVAHERGIVHRDLKPSNVGLTSNGAVKVLDFGVAKTQPTQLSFVTGEDDRATIAAPVAETRDGRVLGTMAYMSPEQARGQTVDKRADIWAFGCVIFEMLTGSAAFGGGSVSDTVVSVLEREPNWKALPASVPPNLRRLVERCLQKDVRRRLRDIGDAHDYLTPLAVTDAGGAITHRRHVEFQRLTDEVGLNESPAISPDGKMVAFVAAVNGRQQVWIRLLTGGTPLQVTRDEVDHLYPRWAPDSSALIYYTPPDDPAGEGELWEVSVLGGVPRPIIGALGGGDISHDGRRIALLRADEGHAVLTTVARDGSDPRPLTNVARGHFSRAPRWSPDDAWLAIQGRGMTVWEDVLWVFPVRGGEPRRLAQATFMRGVAWLPSGTGLVYSSSKGSTMPYPPTFNLCIVDIDGSNDTQITFGDVSFVDPDIHASGRLVVCRIRSESDIWKCPVGESPAENTSRSTRVTKQTGQVQTPSVSPDGSELVYLSDNGGHANLWIVRTDGTRARQITFERDPTITIGMPRWSPAGDAIAYIVNQAREYPQLWKIRPDGRGARKLVERGLWPGWSADGRWLYYTPNVDGEQYTIEKIPATGGSPVVVRDDRNSNAPTVGRDALYFTAFAAPESGSRDWEIRRASPEDGPPETIGLVAAARIPFSPLYFQPALSRDGQWLALGLTDGATSNLWMLSTADGGWRQVTDFDDVATLIVRQVSWSPDGNYLYAAVSKHDGDIVMLVGLV